MGIQDFLGKFSVFCRDPFTNSSIHNYTFYFAPKISKTISTQNIQILLQVPLGLFENLLDFNFLPILSLKLQK